MSRVNISQTVDPNTVLLEVHEQHRRTRLSVLISRTEAECLCDKLRALLGDAPEIVIPGPNLVLFPTPAELQMKVRISKK